MKSLFLLAFAFVCIVIASPVVFAFRLALHDKKSDYLHLVALGLDRLGAVLLYKKLGWTVSSLTYFRYIKREQRENKKALYFYFMQFINFLFFDKEHCKNSYLWEINHRKTNTSKTTLKGLL